jgi:hypothetical protein
MPGSNGSIIAIKPKDKCRFCVDTLLFVLYSAERLIEHILHTIKWVDCASLVGFVLCHFYHNVTSFYQLIKWSCCDRLMWHKLTHAGKMSPHLTVFLKMCFHTKFNAHPLSSTSISPTSQICVASVLVLLMAGN